MPDFFSTLCGRIRTLHGNPEGKVPLHAPIFAGNERQYVLDTLDSTFVSSVGGYVTRFEEQLHYITGARHAVACVNGTSALHVALHLAGVGPEDLVVTQALSFVATANAIAHNGAEPVFLDVDADTLGLSPRALNRFLKEECINTGGKLLHKPTKRRVAACVPMHTFGIPCRIEEIAACCAEAELPLVEDAAEALGSLYRGRHCGTYGQLGILSFNGNKICTTGGGGAILTDDAEFGRLAKHLTTTAKLPHSWEYRHDAVAWNYRMPNINAALGCAQLEQLDGLVAAKRRLAKGYSEIFAETSWRFIHEPEFSRSNYWLCAVLTNNRQERDILLSTFQTMGIMGRPLWEPLHSLPMYKHCPHGNLTVSEDAATRLVNLPSSPLPF